MSRVDVKKTYKLYVGGAFARSESGRTYAALDSAGEVVARVADGSRKDLRDAVRAARAAQTSWAERSGYNRGQILYRVAEMVQDRSETFVDQIRTAGATRAQARREVEKTVDRLVWYAGWGDKFAQVFGNLNPVHGAFFNISSPEPTGVVGIISPEEPALLGLVSRLAPVIISGNAAVLLASQRWPMPAITLCEAVATADVPGGVVNILTGRKDRLVPVLSAHMDVNAIDAWGNGWDGLDAIETAAADSVTRVIRPPVKIEWADDRACQSPYMIADFTELKTIWHPKGL